MSDAVSVSSSESESSGDEGVYFDLAIGQALKALAENKSLPDPILPPASKKPQKERQKKVTLKDQLLEHLEAPDESFDDEPLEKKPTPAEEDRLLREDAIRELTAAAPDTDDESDLLEAVASDAETEESAVNEDERRREARQMMKTYFEAKSNNSNADNFLKDYFVNERWKERSSKRNPAAVEDSLSTKALLADSERGEIQSDVLVKNLEVPSDDEDAAEVAKADAFEVKYNFRFEEKGGSQIVGHARGAASDTIAAVVKESKRARKRREAKEAREAAKKDLDTTPEVDLDLIQADADYPSDQEWFLCDGCEKPIGGGKIKFDCRVCEDFNLCKICQKSIQHEHSLFKSRVPQAAEPPKGWKTAVEEQRKSDGDADSGLVRSILAKHKIEPGFKYVDVSPLDGGLTNEEILATDETLLNSILPPTILNPFEDQSKVQRLLSSSRRKLSRARGKTGVLPPAPADDETSAGGGEVEQSIKRVHFKPPEKKKTRTKVMEDADRPKNVSKRRLEAYGIQVKRRKKQDP